LKATSTGTPYVWLVKAAFFQRFSFTPIHRFISYSHMFGPYPSIFHGKSQFLMVKSQFFMVKSPFLMGERVKSPFFLLNSPHFFSTFQRRLGLNPGAVPGSLAAIAATSA
jgi:hypothetical protein